MVRSRLKFGARNEPAQSTMAGATITAPATFPNHHVAQIGGKLVQAASPATLSVATPMVALTGVLAPAATPPAVVSRIHQTIAESLRSPKLREVMQSSGLDPVANSPAAFAQSLRDEIAKWGKVVKAAGLAVQ